MLSYVTPNRHYFNNTKNKYGGFNMSLQSNKNNRKKKFVYLSLCIYIFLIMCVVIGCNYDSTSTNDSDIDSTIKTINESLHVEELPMLNEESSPTDKITTPFPEIETLFEDTDINAIFTITPIITPIPTLTPLVINPEILRLREEYGNNDIIGYLNIEGTSIEYPVVQAEDNEFYLRHNIYMEPDVAGWVFLDYENDLYSNLDRNIIIYGHNMRQQMRFHDIRYYVDENYFKYHPTIVFNTINGDNEWEIFTFFRTHTSFNYIEIFIQNNDAWKDTLAKMKEMSMYDTGIEVSSDDLVILLSTCTNETDENGNFEWRYVLGAKSGNKNP